jgi:DNA adenine methylase
VPAKFGRYFEPFVGGGAVFFDLFASGRIDGVAYLNDVNAELVTTYQAVRDDVDNVVGELSRYAERHSRSYYYEIRASDPMGYFKGRLRGPVTAARMIYLNRTCFNGLYRVNKAGKFNVPMGKYANPTICDADNLRACSRALSCATLTCSDFTSVLEAAREGDFAYCDCPYWPASNTSNFTKYTSIGFSSHDQRRLRDEAVRLKKCGVRVLLSNSDVPDVRDLYSHPDFSMKSVSASRRINSKTGKRGAVGELLIW